MYRANLRTRLFEDGSLELIDPDLESLPLLKQINPGFKIKRAKLKGFRYPSFQQARKQYLQLTKDELKVISTEKLWAKHDSLVNNLKNGKYSEEGNVTLLDLKIELARRELKECRLCGRDCGVDRISGQKGYCGMGIEGKVAECFVHIAEEAPINPSVNVNVRGCGLRCRFCQKHELLDPAGQGQMLEASLWKELHAKTAKSISFVGGNPDESIYAVLRFLVDVPSGFIRPIVWNSNGYASSIVYKLLEGIVDVYIPDMKFYRGKCSNELSGCNNYFDIFTAGLVEMLKQNVPIFVRMLLLPGHLECCHIPLIDYLLKYKAKVKLNILGQYYPDYMISEVWPLLSRRPDIADIKYARAYAERMGGADWLISSEYERK